MSIAGMLVDKIEPSRQKWREKRIVPFVAMLEAVHTEKGSVEIVDLGGTRRYWDILPEDIFDRLNVRITIINFASEMFASSDRFQFVEGTACDVPYSDMSFDVVHSNSVIEHVGRWPEMKAFARETQRLAQRFWVQTPNFWFPIEPHCSTPFYHWLPIPWRVSLLMRTNLGVWGRCRSLDEAQRAVESSVLLDRRMMRALFPGSTILTERLAGLPKSLIAVRS